MFNKQEMQKNFKDLFSFFSHYIVIIFNEKKRDDYINNHSCKSIITYIVTFGALATIILYAISQIYQITKPLPIIYLPIYIIIFSALYFIPMSITSDVGKEKNEILKWLKQMIFSSLIISSFNCTIFTIIYCIFIISESYMIYYSMIVLIILVSIYHYIHLILRYKHDVSYRGYKKFNILRIVRPLLALVYIYCVLNLVFLCQFNFIYKGKKFIYTFDPIFQEMLDNSSNGDAIMKYILINTK
jgi:hypothetical protein